MLSKYTATSLSVEALQPNVVEMAINEKEDKNKQIEAHLKEGLLNYRVLKDKQIIRIFKNKKVYEFQV